MSRFTHSSAVAIGFAALVLLLSGCSEEQPAPAAEPAAETAAETAAAAPGAAASPAERREAMKLRADRVREQIANRTSELREQARVRGDWWQDEAVVGELGLGVEQQQAIEAMVAERRDQAQQRRRNLQQANRDYRDAVTAGELDRAREALRRQAPLLVDEELAQRGLLLDLLDTLEPAQRQQLLESHGRQLLRSSRQPLPRAGAAERIAERRGWGRSDDDGAGDD